MKYFNSIVLLLFSLLSFIAYSKAPLTDDSEWDGPDLLTYDYQTTWLLTEKLVWLDDWEPVAGHDTLFLSFNYDNDKDDILASSGVYVLERTDLLGVGAACNWWGDDQIALCSRSSIGSTFNYSASIKYFYQS